MVRPWLAIAALALGCGSKEAEDPHSALAEDYERAGAEQADDNAARAPDPGLEPATRAECEAAIRHLFALGGARERAEEGVIREDVDECLERGTSRREAQCIAKVQSETEIEACSQH